MTVVPYIIVSNSNASLTKRFVVLFQGYKPSQVKSETIQRTLDGKIDASRGKTWEVHNYMIRVPFQTSDPDMGTMDDLKAFHALNNPAGTPSDVLTVTDHYGTVRTALMTKDFTPESLSVMVDGDEASFLVNVTFEFIDVVVGS